MAKKAKRATDAITVLKDDHKKVKALLASLEKTTERGAERRTKLLRQIEAEVHVHATIEEEIFYPAYREAVKKKDDVELYQEALEEHHVVDLVMPELKESDPAGEVFGAKAKVLKELIEHHAGEEEKEMFKKARQAMGKEELLDLGSRLQERKKQLKAAGSPRGGQGGQA
jgi:hemerythrin HHE cation binding domain-containing protein